jgi:hypothetical protein
MSTVNTRSLLTSGAGGTHRIGLTAALVLAVSSGAAATEPSVAVEYRSAFADYRPFDAQAPAADWRAANDAIRDGAEVPAHEHGMHDMRAKKVAAPTAGDASADQAGTQPSPSRTAPHEGHEPTVTTPDEHLERRE